MISSEVIRLIIKVKLIGSVFSSNRTGVKLIDTTLVKVIFNFWL